MSRKTVFAFLDAHRDRDARRIQELCDDGIHVYGPGWELSGVEHYVESQKSIWNQISNQKIAIEDVIGEKDKIAVQWIDRAEHPSDRGAVEVMTAGCSVFTVNGDKIVEIAQYNDTLDVIRQIRNS